VDAHKTGAIDQQEPWTLIIILVVYYNHSW